MIGTILFFIIVWRTFYGEKAEANEWGEGATTLEWTVASPAPWHTHEVLPDMTGKARPNKKFRSMQVTMAIRTKSNGNWRWPLQDSSLQWWV